MHHKQLGIHESESFGMLFVSKKYWDKVRRDEAIQNNG
jgi:beta-carotene 3-hydroxylase